MRAEYPRCAPRDPLRPVGQTWTGSLPGTEHASPGQINPDENHLLDLRSVSEHVFSSAERDKANTHLRVAEISMHPGLSYDPDPPPPVTPTHNSRAL